jgi:hypothetical protein
MAGGTFTGQSQAFSEKTFAGGLNSTAGPFALDNSQSSDLENIDFDVYGSISKRNGYTVFNPVATSGSNLRGDGIYWYEYNNAGTTDRYMIHVSGGIFYSSLSASGTWTNITGTGTYTALYHCDFETFLNEVYITNGFDVPCKWTGTSTSTNMASVMPTGLTSAKFVKVYNNYLFLANVKVSSVYYPSRIYWSNLKNTGVWDSASWIEVAKDDGDEITAIRVLGNNLVIYKTRSIYTLSFTGDSDIPFILPGGGKSNSNVGCIASWSIQEVNNGHVFLADDGFYYFDGNNSYKISDPIRTTLLSYIKNGFPNAVSNVIRNKNRYLCALPSESSTVNDKVIVWDFINNSFSIYSGMDIADMCTVFINGTDERPYFSDYNGYSYRLDYGTDDYPLNVRTAISAYYYTNWKSFDDLVNQKGVLEAILYYMINDATLTFAYSYDFETADQYTLTIPTYINTSKWDSIFWDIDKWASSGGGFRRVDLDGRGRVIRFKFSNNTLGETFRIDGLGLYAHLETNV